jgi:hypothetical protein
MNLYLSGPMRGRPDLNRPAFAYAAAELRASGFVVFNPGEQPDNEIRANLAVDMAWICAHADAVALLSGWQESKGAMAEASLGFALGILVAPFETFLKPAPLD